MALPENSQQYVTKGLATQEQLEQLSDFAKTVFSEKQTGAHNVIEEKLLTLDQILELHDAVIEALQKETVRNGIKHGALPFELLSAVTTTAAAIALDSDGAQELITLGILTVDHIAQMDNVATAVALRDPKVCEFIKNDGMTMEQALALTEPASNALMTEGVRSLIIDGFLELTRVLDLNCSESRAIRDSGAQQYIRNRLLTVEEALTLSESALGILQEGGIPDLLQSKHLTTQHLAAITRDAARNALKLKSAQLLIESGKLTPSDIALIENRTQISALEDDQIYDAITSAEVTTEAVLKHFKHNIYSSAETRKCIRSGELTAALSPTSPKNTVGLYGSQQRTRVHADGNGAADSDTSGKNDRPTKCSIC